MMLMTRACEEAKARMQPLALLKFLLLFLALGLAYSLLTIFTTPRYIGIQNVITTPAGFRPCHDVSGLAQWIRPPSELVHDMADEQLFWRASFVPRVKTYPFKRVPKVALMFLAKGPLPLYPLWEEFLDGHEGLYSIYVHSLPNYIADFPPGSVFYRRQIPSQVSEWGKMSMCDAERRLLANALLDISNEWFVLLSETCIPLFNFNHIYKYLTKSRYGFIGAFDDPSPYGRGRYNESMAPEVNITQWRKGSQWFAVPRHLAITIVKDTTYHRKFKEFCTPPCYVDEHYFPTLLYIEAPQHLANRSVTWVDWSRGGAHPATFGKNDISETFFRNIFRTNNCSSYGQPGMPCFLFGRKFAPSTLEPLLELAPKFLGFGSRQQRVV